MEFIFSFGPCGNLVVLVLLFFAMTMLAGGLFSGMYWLVKRMNKKRYKIV